MQHIVFAHRLPQGGHAFAIVSTAATDRIRVMPDLRVVLMCGIRVYFLLRTPNWHGKRFLSILLLSRGCWKSTLSKTTVPFQSISYKNLTSACLLNIGRRIYLFFYSHLSSFLLVIIVHSLRATAVSSLASIAIMSIIRDILSLNSVYI